jgi:hypothetical protein
LKGKAGLLLFWVIEYEKKTFLAETIRTELTAMVFLVICLMRILGVTAFALVALVTLLSAKSNAFDEAIYQIRWAEKKNVTCVTKQPGNRWLILSPIYPPPGIRRSQVHPISLDPGGSFRRNADFQES